MSDKKSFFSPESLQILSLSFNGLTPEEIKKQKELHVRNAIAEYHAGLQKDKADSFGMIFFVLIPFFWPVLYAQVRKTKIEHQEKRTHIENALVVWKDDLWDKHADLLALLNKDEDIKQSQKVIWPLSLFTK